MRPLPKPTADPEQVFRTCIRGIRSLALRTRLQAVAPTIAAAATIYDAAAQAASLHTLPKQPDVGPTVSSGDMRGVYDRGMVGSKAGRPIYDRLMATPPYGRCPLCGQRTVSTLDHHLPASAFAALTVVPTNLIPACGDCNKLKLSVVPTSAEEQTFHPYFDDLGPDRWLRATVLHVAPAALEFYVDPPAPWGPIMQARVNRHFAMLKLGQLYASHAAEEVSNLRHQARLLFQRIGVGGVAEHLSRQAESYEAANINSWQSATYRALADSQWYCGGGFE